MEERLRIDLTGSEGVGSDPPRLRVVARGQLSGESGVIYLTEESDGIEPLELAVEALKAQLDSMVDQAREPFRLYQPEKEDMEKKPKTVEEIWLAMEKCTRIEEIQGIFNTLDVEKRREVADYILTQVNIFKGAGAMFAQHFKRDAYLLEEGV